MLLGSKLNFQGLETVVKPGPAEAVPETNEVGVDAKTLGSGLALSSFH